MIDQIFNKINRLVLLGFVNVFLGVAIWLISFFKITSNQDMLLSLQKTQDLYNQYAGALDWWKNAHVLAFQPLSIVLIFSGALVLTYFLVQKILKTPIQNLEE